MTLYTEVTPNPASLKFVADATLLATGTADFPTAAEAQEGSELASHLFKYPFVQGVFIGRNFVTITKQDGSRWEDIIPAVKEEIKAFLASGLPVVHGAQAVVAESNHGGTDVERRIQQLIDEQVRPAVAMDGGDIIYEGFEDGVVKLKLRGSCSGCPSSIITLKQGIQGLLMRMVPEVKAVEAL